MKASSRSHDQEDDIGKSKVVRELSPSRVYSKNVDTYRVLVPALFKQHDQLKRLRPLRAPSIKAVDPESNKPRLLQRLVAILERKLASAEKLAAAYGPMRAGWAASMLRLDAYRQVFEALVNSMTTYKPLLMRIKHEYDIALEDALKSSYQNIQMRAELTDAQIQQAKSVESALQESEASAVTLRKNLLDQLAETEQRALAAENRAAELQNESGDARKQLRALQRKGVELQKENDRMLQQMLQRSTWLAPPTQP